MMNPAQKQAIEKVREILGEHFDSNVVIVAFDEGSGDSSYIAYGGGFYYALGLLSDAYHKQTLDHAMNDTKETNGS